MEKINFLFERVEWFLNLTKNKAVESLLIFIVICTITISIVYINRENKERIFLNKLIDSLRNENYSIRIQKDKECELKIQDCLRESKESTKEQLEYMKNKLEKYEEIIDKHIMTK